jgi:hypothetical protein
VEVVRELLTSPSRRYVGEGNRRHVDEGGCNDDERPEISVRGMRHTDGVPEAVSSVATTAAAISEQLAGYLPQDLRPAWVKLVTDPANGHTRLFQLPCPRPTRR